MIKFTLDDHTMHKQQIYNIFTSPRLTICLNKDFKLSNTTRVFVFVVQLSSYHMTCVTFYFNIKHKKFTKKGDYIQNLSMITTPVNQNEVITSCVLF